MKLFSRLLPKKIYQARLFWAKPEQEEMMLHLTPCIVVPGDEDPLPIPFRECDVPLHYRDAAQAEKDLALDLEALTQYRQTLNGYHKKGFLGRSLVYQKMYQASSAVRELACKVYQECKKDISKAEWVSLQRAVNALDITAFMAAPREENSRSLALSRVVRRYGVE